MNDIGISKRSRNFFHVQWPLRARVLPVLCRCRPSTGWGRRL